MQNVCPQQPVFTSQRIDQYFRASRAVGEIIKRMPGGFTAVIENLRCFVIAGAGQRHLIQPALGRHLFKTEILIFNAHLTVAEGDVSFLRIMNTHQHLNHAPFDDFRRVLRRFTVQVSAG
ncbi:hypothetical protein SRABI106_03104 [Rahnella aquatilis]|nr:hypothetical protein SRABI106_03104 [Rahnella aquatilis]